MSNSELYTPLLQKMANILYLENVTGTEEEKRKADEVLKTARPELLSDSQKLISDLFNSGKKKAEILLDVTQELDTLMSRAESSWYPTITRTKELLEKQVEVESNKRSLSHKIAKNSWRIILLVIATSALSVRFSSAVKVTDPITEKSGLIQRSAAFAKILRYDDLMLERGDRKGGPLKTVLYWPVEPTKDEITYAEEFIGAAKEVYANLLSQSAICNVPEAYTADPASAPKEVLAFIQKNNYGQIDDPIKLIAAPFIELFPCSE